MDEIPFELECPHCEADVEITIFGDESSNEAPIFCPMCGIDCNEAWERC